MIRITLSVLLLATVLPANADWTGVGEAGLVSSSGNTETETGNAKLEFATEIDKWKHTAGLSGLYASTEGDKTAQRWGLYEQSDYNFGPKNFAFGAVSYEDDEFSGFAYQATVSGGLGRKFIQNDRTQLTGTAGVGYKFFEIEDTEDALGNVIAEGEKDSEAIFRGTLDFAHALTDTTSITNGFSVEAGSTNTFLVNELALSVKMSDKLALAVGFAVRHNTDAPDGFKSTDKLTTVNLVYQIK